jgi:hypothetical protein
MNKKDHSNNKKKKNVTLPSQMRSHEEPWGEEPWGAIRTQEQEGQGTISKWTRRIIQMIKGRRMWRYLHKWGAMRRGAMRSHKNPKARKTRRTIANEQERLYRREKERREEKKR